MSYPCPMGRMRGGTVLTSLQNPKVKGVVKLRQRRKRDETGRFLIEGYRELLRAAHAKIAIEQVFFCQEFFLGCNEPALIQTIEQQGGEVLACSSSVFGKLSYRDRPDGLLAIARHHPLQLADLQAKLSTNRPPLIVVAEAIEKPGNLGTILRSSDATGVDGVIVCDRCTDITNPNVVRASVGTLFTVPIVEVGGEETLAWLKQQGIQIAAATPSATTLYTEADLTGPLALAVGTEQLGLSKQWMEAADLQLKLPMLGVADSLNVATCTTVFLYEVLRQRGASLR